MDKTKKALMAATLLFGFNASVNAEVIGYVSDHRFHPLIVVNGGAVAEAHSRSLSLVGTLRNAFEPSPTVLSITGQENYEDAYSDEPERFGTVKGQSSDDAFYLLGGAASLPSEVPPRALKRSFYEFFSRDPWGQYFVEGAGAKDPATALEKDNSIRVLYATDLDSDGKKELWITYRLMYGEIGRMVWEQESPTQWHSLANHCFNCD